MRKLTLTIVLSLVLMSNVFAAHCPAADEFVQIKGMLWGAYWSLIPSVSDDWYIQDQYAINAPTFYFPNESTLLVRIEPQSGEVRCLYLLPNNSRLAIFPHNNKKVDRYKTDLDIFSPQHIDNGIHITNKTSWEKDNSITTLACNTTAYNSNICHWTWSYE